MSKVLVTGGSGFLGAYVIHQLLQSGHSVRTTIRDLAKEPSIRQTLARAGSRPDDKLTCVRADLASDEGWDAAVSDCDFVQHVASPFPSTVPRNEDDLIIPAREGTLRVLRAAKSSGVKRVVLTSSFAAIGYGHGRRSEPLTEADWSNENARLSPYVKSKLLAEKAAWDFAAQSGLDLSVVNPVFILGPVLSDDFSSSVLLIKNMLDGNMKKAPKISFGIVDVRDVADLHIRAMTHPAAAGQRFIAAAGASMTMKEIGHTVAASVPEGRSISEPEELPNWIVRIASLWKPEVRQFTGELGLPRHCSSEKARTLLDWKPRSNEEAIQSCAQSILALGND